MARRRAMTPARKRRIWLREAGVCWMCGQPVEESGPNVRYDHRGTLYITESDDDADIFPIHLDPCDKTKTPKDQTRIAKTKRQARMCLEVPREEPRRKIKSRGFGDQHRKLQSRPFATRTRP